MGEGETRIAGVPTTYCGPAPLPEALWQQWNLDPIVLILLLIGTGTHLAACRDAVHAERICLAGGIGALVVAFVSPLCALSVALFSARVAHHVLLVAVAAPLLALAFRRQARAFAAVATPTLLLFTVVFWLWHAPAAYGLALADTGVYWLMQVTLLATAALFWAAIFSAASGPAIVALLGASIQMGLLGALLVFAPDPLYAPHLTATQSFGLDPLTDQQLAGLIMWVPASLPYLFAVLLRLHGLLEPRQARQP